MILKITVAIALIVALITNEAAIKTGLWEIGILLDSIVSMLNLYSV